MSRITKLREIADTKQHDTIDGVLVDVMTAKVIVMCYDQGNDETKHVIESFPIKDVGKTAWKVVKTISHGLNGEK